MSLLVFDQRHHQSACQIAQLLTDAEIVVRADEVIAAAVLTADYVHNEFDARCFLVDSGQIAEDMPGIDIVYSSEFSRPRRRSRRRVARRGTATAI